MASGHVHGPHNQWVMRLCEDCERESGCHHPRARAERNKKGNKGNRPVSEYVQNNICQLICCLL